MEILQTVRSLPRVQKVFLGMGISFLLYALFGFFAAPPLLKYFLTRNLSESLRREVEIGKVRVNPFVLSVSLDNFSIKDRDPQQTFLSFGELHGNFQILSLVKKGVIFKEIRLGSPYLLVARRKDGSYNFSDLIEKFASKPESSAGSGPRASSQPFRFSLNNIQMRDGRIDILDGPKDIRHAIRDINVNIPFLSNLPYYVDTYVQPVLEATVNGTPVSFRGKTKPFKDSLETTFDFRKF